MRLNLHSKSKISYKWRQDVKKRITMQENRLPMLQVKLLKKQAHEFYAVIAGIWPWADSPVLEIVTQHRHSLSEKSTRD